MLVETLAELEAQERRLGQIRREELEVQALLHAVSPAGPSQRPRGKHQNGAPAELAPPTHRALEARRSGSDPRADRTSRFYDPEYDPASRWYNAQLASRAGPQSAYGAAPAGGGSAGANVPKPPKGRRMLRFGGGGRTAKQREATLPEPTAPPPQPAPPLKANVAEKAAAKVLQQASSDRPVGMGSLYYVLGTQGSARRVAKLQDTLHHKQAR